MEHQEKAEIASAPNLFYTQEAQPIPVIVREKEIFLTANAGKSVNYTIRAFPTQKLDIHRLLQLL